LFIINLPLLGQVKAEQTNQSATALNISEQDPWWVVGTQLGFVMDTNSQKARTQYDERHRNKTGFHFNHLASPEIEFVGANYKQPAWDQ